MNLIGQLNTLESTGLVRLAVVQPELEYLFRHALMQDVAYGSLLKQDRKQLHTWVGEALEQLFPDQLNELAATLAYHYEKAEAHDKAIHYLRRAGDRARDSYANAEAIAFYQAALSQLKKLDNTSAGDQREILKRLLEDSGDLQELSGEHEAARNSYGHTLAVLTADERIWRARLLRKTAYSWMVQVQHEKALAVYDEAENSLGPEPTVPDIAWWQEWIQIQVDRMWLRYVRNEVTELNALIEKTQPCLEQFGTPAQRYGFYRGVTLAAFRRERYQMSEQTLAAAQTGLTHAQASNNLSIIAEAQFLVGLCQAHRGQWAMAEEQMLAGVKLSEQVGNVTTLARTLTHLTNLYRRCGRMVEVREFNAQTLKVAKAGQLREYIAAAQANTAWLAWRAGQLTEAQHQSEAAVESWQKIAHFKYPFQWTALWTLLAMAVAQGRLPEAVDYVRQLIAPVQIKLPDTITTKLTDAIGAWEQDRREDAHAHLGQAVRLAQETGYL